MLQLFDIERFLFDREIPCDRVTWESIPRRPKLGSGLDRGLPGPVAQWLEPAAHNGLVAGSSPARPTLFFLYFLLFSTAFFRFLQ